MHRDAKEHPHEARNSRHLYPVLSVSELTKATGLSKHTVSKSLSCLIALGIITPTSERKCGQLYTYTAYTRLLVAE